MALTVHSAVRHTGVLIGGLRVIILFMVLPLCVLELHPF